MKTKVLIQMEGGVIQAIFVNNQEVEIIVQDFDVGETDEGIFQLSTGEYCTAVVDNVILNPELVENIYSVASK